MNKMSLIPVSQKDFEKQNYHHLIGALTFYDPGRKLCFGSCVLISQNLILTTASNIFNRHYLRQNSDFKVYIGVNGVAHNYSQVEAWRYLNDFKSQNIPKFDYAILKLKQDLSLKDCLKCSFECQNCIRNHPEVGIYGYPSSKSDTYNYLRLKNKSQFRLEQYGIKKKAQAQLDFSCCEIKHGLEVKVGMVGSPIFINGHFVGIHKGTKYQRYNSTMKKTALIDCTNKQNNLKDQEGKLIKTGVLFSCQALGNIQKWSKQLCGLPILTDKLCVHLQELKNEKVINLSVQSHQRIQFLETLLRSNEKFNNLEDLNLERNHIQDKGLELLCRNQFPSMKVVNLENNGISFKGMKHIYFNKWSQNVKVQLYAVTSQDGGFHVKAGQSIPIIKKHIKSKTIDILDQMLTKEKAATLNAIQLFLETSFSEDIKSKVQESQKIKAQYMQKSQKEPFSLATVLLTLGKQLNNTLYLSKEPNLQTGLSSKIIFEGLSQQRIKFSQKLKKLNNFHFSDFKNDHKKLKEFEAWYMEFLRKEYGVNTSEMRLHKVNEGCIQTDVSDTTSNAQTVNLSFFEKIPQEVRQFFESLQLSENQFDSRGNYNFPQGGKGEVQERGGMVYYQPVCGRRFGIKVSGLYDNGNDNWLSMNKVPGQWAVAFHGINYPSSLCNGGLPKSKQNPAILRSFMNGRQSGTMFRRKAVSGKDAQACQDQICIKTGKSVGAGFYVSPHFLTSLFSYCATSNEPFRVILQCRVLPSAIKISSSKNDFWVINESKDLRPYGICLFSQQEFNKISNMGGQRNIYGEEFTRQTWKNKYEPIYKKFHGLQ